MTGMHKSIKESVIIPYGEYGMARCGMLWYGMVCVNDHFVWYSFVWYVVFLSIRVCTVSYCKVSYCEVGYGMVGIRAVRKTFVDLLTLFYLKAFFIFSWTKQLKQYNFRKF